MGECNNASMSIMICLVCSMFVTKCVMSYLVMLLCRCEFVVCWFVYEHHLGLGWGLTACLGSCHVGSPLGLYLLVELPVLLLSSV